MKDPRNKETVSLFVKAMEYLIKEEKNQKSKKVGKNVEMSDYLICDFEQLCTPNPFLDLFP